MSPHGPHDHERLDAYWDGLLAPAEQEAFERALATDDKLRAQVGLQRSIDEHLRRAFAPPAPPADVASVNGRGVGGIRSRTPQVPVRRWRGLAAAMVLIGLLGALRLWIFLDERPSPNAYDPGPKRTLAEAYHNELQSGFIPDWECKDQLEAARRLRRQFGQALVLEPVPGIVAIGWSYVNTTSPLSLALLVNAGDERVVVFIDRASPAEPAPGALEDGLRIYEREIGELSLHEVSTLDHPVVLDHFRIP